MKDPYIALAQQAITAYIKTGQIIKPPPGLPEKMVKKKAGVFVSLHHCRTDDLLGCIGTFLPTQKNIAQEIIRNAVAAATTDPRFPAITKKELPDLKISVDVLSKPRSAQKKDLDPQKYGLIISSSDNRRGLLLPDLPGVATAAQQINICRQKAGIDANEKIKLERFTVARHH